MRELRARVLRSLEQTLVDVFEPILMLDTSVEVQSLLKPDGTPHASKPPKITTTGRETLRNAVHDFVLRDSEKLKSLRSVDASVSCVSNALIWLRRLTLAMAITSGIFLIMAILSGFEVWPVEADWPHIMGFVASGALLCVIVVFIYRIMHSINVFEELKDKHGNIL